LKWTDGFCRQKKPTMLWTIFVILVILWLLGLIGGNTIWRIHSYPAGHRHRLGIDSSHSGTKTIVAVWTLAKSLAHETVTGLPGVKSVNNRLELEGEPPTANSDAWLSAKVKATLLFHRSVSAGKTEVDVKDGIVTLRGDAASQAQKELTTEYAKDIEGVKDVKNEMTIE
jgi:hypothetical protein